jgi:hypothetical protein
MRSRILTALAFVAALVVALVGCSKRDLGVAPQLALKSFASIGAQGDSTPNPHPQPPSDTLIIPVQFVSADSTEAGHAGTSRWLLGNAGQKPFTTTWILTADPTWPGYPITGTLRIGPSRVVPLSVPVPVPFSAVDGLYTLRMAVLTPSADTSVAFGSIRVFGNEPPPPPPPLAPAVVFVGADSIQAGTTGQTRWEVTNESSHDFTMTWTLSTPYQWPGLPKQGTVFLGPNQQQQLVVSVAVPDTVQAGPRRLDMQVTRPDSLPSASAPAWILVTN